MNESAATQDASLADSADLRIPIEASVPTTSDRSSALFGHAYHRYLLVADLTALFISVTLTPVCSDNLG